MPLFPMKTVKIPFLWGVNYTPKHHEKNMEASSNRSC